jgi:23S rRNA (guanosine2251-2'-O)-methyltransferase
MKGPSMKGRGRGHERPPARGHGQEAERAPAGASGRGPERRRERGPSQVSASGLDLIHGFHAVEALVARAPARVRGLVLSSERGDARLARLLALAESARIGIRRANPAELQRLAGDVPHQGVLAEVTPAEEPYETELFDLVADLLAIDDDGHPRPGATPASDPPLLLVLDEVTDPRNFGALLRVADGAGVQAVVTTKRNSPPLTAVVHKAAAGAASLVPIYRVTNLARTLTRLREQGVWILGLDDEAPTPWHAADLRAPTALVLGAEGPGMRRLTREHCDTLVHLPMAGVASSLNVSVAAGIALYEARRQRGVR